MHNSEIDIIIPTHNGARSLAATLESLERQITSVDRVWVVINGCTDESASVAESQLIRIRAKAGGAAVLHCSQAGRHAALTAGDACARGHRLYLDQDAVLSAGGLALIREAFDAGADFVAGRAIWRTDSKPVQHAMNAWNELPYVRAACVTAGMYAISQRGRLRWSEWPPALPDDKWARLHFRRAERINPPALMYCVEAPKSFTELVAARRRYARMNRDLSAGAPELVGAEISQLTGMLPYFARRRNFPGAYILAASELLARLNIIFAMDRVDG